VLSACLPPLMTFMSGHRQVARVGAAQVAEQRQVADWAAARARPATRPGWRWRPLGLVGRAVEVDQQPIDANLVEGVWPEQLEAMVSLTFLTAWRTPLAEVPALVVVAQLDGLVGPVLAPDGTAARPPPRLEIHLDSSVGLPRLVEDFACLDASMLLMNGQ